VRGAPEHLRSDNGPEFVAKEIQEWLARACVRTLSIQKASPWENGYVESFNSRLRDELLDRELFLSLPEARVVLDQWRMDYTHRRPHGGLKWLTPAAFVAGLDDTASGVVPAASRGVSPVGARGFSHKTSVESWGGGQPEKARVFGIAASHDGRLYPQPASQPASDASTLPTLPRGSNAASRGFSGAPACRYRPKTSDWTGR
jgi:putative transposase